MFTQVRAPYPRSAGFDTDIGAFIESSSVPSPIGRMPLPVFKDGIFADGPWPPAKLSG